MDEQRERAAYEHHRLQSTVLKRRCNELQLLLRQIHQDSAQRILLQQQKQQQQQQRNNIVATGENHTASSNDNNDNGSSNNDDNDNNNDNINPNINKNCSYCKTQSKKLNRCSQCHSVWYCSKECQRLDWGKKGGGHRLECNKVKRQQSSSSSNNNNTNNNSSDDDNDDNSNNNKEKCNYWISSNHDYSEDGPSPSSFFQWDEKEAVVLISAELESIQNKHA